MGGDSFPSEELMSRRAERGERGNTGKRRKDSKPPPPSPPSSEVPQRVTPPPQPAIVARLLRPDDLCARLGVSARTLERMVERGQIGPAKLRLANRVVVWDGLEIEAWLTHRTAEGGLYDTAGWAAIRDQVMSSLPPLPPATSASSAPSPTGKPGKRRKRD